MQHIYGFKCDPGRISTLEIIIHFSHSVCSTYNLWHHYKKTTIYTRILQIDLDQTSLYGGFKPVVRYLDPPKV